MNRTEAERIAKEFLNETNPDMWNGKDGKPNNFDTRIFTYDIQSANNNELDISLEYEENPETGKKEWTHYCELRDKDNGDLIEVQHGYGIDSVLNLADTILDICRNE